MTFRPRLMMLASVVLALSASCLLARAQDGSSKANFNLHADSATVSDGILKLSGVSPVVFVIESGSQSAYGVTESTTFFLERWEMLEHDIRPHGILFTSADLHDSAYRALRFDIDNPSQSPDDSADWVFEIDHIDDAVDFFKDTRVIEPVMLTIVMEHTREEVAEGRVCGPWNLSDLRNHHELFDE